MPLTHKMLFGPKTLTLTGNIKVGIRVRGPRNMPPFKQDEKVLISNDKVILKATVTYPLYNVNYDEILRQAEWGIVVHLEQQEYLDALLWDVANFNRGVEVNHANGVWQAIVHQTIRSSSGAVELTLTEG